MTRWKLEPLNPKPFSPVHKARKFSAVFGTTSARNSMMTRPAGVPPIVISKKTFGLDLPKRKNEKSSDQDDVMVSQQTKKMTKQAPDSYIIICQTFMVIHF